MPTTRNVPRDASGLLEQIAENALDDDYYVVRAGETHGRRSNGLVVALVLATFAVLVTVAAVQTRTDRPSSDLERQTLATDVQARRDVLADRQATAEQLRAEVADLQAGTGGDDSELEDLRVLTADRAARGPGLLMQVIGSRDDLEGRITATDLQVLVNSLWYAGAEAIAIDGQRLSSLTSVQSVDGVITVNYQTVAPPFRVVALGDAEALQTRFEAGAGGRYWEERRQDAGVDLDVSPSDDVGVPAAPQERLTLSYARAVEEDR